MTFDVIDPATLETIHRIESWKSMSWKRGYNTDGRFLLEVENTAENVRLLAPGQYLREHGTTNAVVLRAAYNESGGKTWVVTGYPLADLCRQRVSTTVIAQQDAETALRALFTECFDGGRAITGLTLDDAAGIGLTYTQQLSGKSLYDYAQTICQALDIGYRVRMTGSNKQKRLLFGLYRPERNPNLKYRVAYGNLESVQIKLSDVDYANVALVLGAGEGASRAQVIVGDIGSTGADRHEIIVDARDIQPGDGESATDKAYLDRLAMRGVEKLLECKKVDSLTFVPADDRAQLGDIVTCIVDGVRLEASARVTEIELTSKNGELSRKLTVGTPVIRRR
mgnify:FL=1